ncbi:thiamine phosphate synthase [Numidum massiliense]|uniref:thiamine phosphate synthase n=1 Tax=Numidum massiliense TaxID=1522315 RepID=UPI0006D536FD|nr:thiamine phosphate synthase [Numidum massiliense]
MLSKDDLQLYFILGSEQCPTTSPLDVLQQAIRGGVTCFQFREKNTAYSVRDTLTLGKALRAECRRAGIPFIVNDDVELALLLNADGVHVGQSDTPAKEARKRIGDKMSLGVSAHTVAEAERAITDGADYLGVGPVFPTKTKQDAKEPLTPVGLERFIAQLPRSVPIVAIGGITAANASEVIRTGVCGVSVISAIAAQADPERAAATLRHTIVSAQGEIPHA